MDIEFSPRTAVNMYFRHLHDDLSCLPSGTPAEWDKKLKEFDPELSLRLAYRSQRFLIFYDHHGTLSVIYSFGHDKPFGLVFAAIKHRSIMNAKWLKQARREINEAEEKRQDYEIEQCAGEFGTELHHACRGRVMTSP